MNKCQYCEKEVPQKDGKRARLFCNGNCRNKYYYQKQAANKPKKKVGRPKKTVAEKGGLWYVPEGMGAKSEVTNPKVTWFPPHTPNASDDIQSQIDKLTAEMNAIQEGNFGTPLRNKIQDKIAKLKKLLK